MKSVQKKGSMVPSCMRFGCCKGEDKDVFYVTLALDENTLENYAEKIKYHKRTYGRDGTLKPFIKALQHTYEPFTSRDV
jgi:hypothetical protein